MEPKRTMKRLNVGLMIWWGVGLLLGAGLFIFLQNFVACWRLTALPGIALPACSGGGNTVVVTNPLGTPQQVTVTPTINAPSVALPAPWDGASRVNVLVMGLDERDVADIDQGILQGPPRTDTMILLTIDPLSKTAAAISIPRDLWINIPGFDYAKINTAYTLGELYKLPGGGPGLAMKAVESFLGIQIQYFAWIEFSAFIKAIDDVGGVDVCVPEAITVALYDQDGQVHLEPGCQTLSGIVALGYARNRYTANGDVDRSNRQMQVIEGLREKILSPDNWAMIVTKAPDLYNQLSSGIHTNMNLSDAMRLAALLREIPRSSIQMKVIDYTMMTDTKAPDGTDILRPFPDKVRVLRDQIFGGGVLMPAASGDPTQLMKNEAASVIVINGTGTAGLASKTADYLKAQGMNVTAFGNTTDYPDSYKSPFPNRTIIIVHSGRPYAMKYLETLMKFDSSSQVIMKIDPTAPADLIVGLGYDWVVP